MFLDMKAEPAKVVCEERPQNRIIVNYQETLSSVFAASLWLL
jgi:hypothetical protein